MTARDPWPRRTDRLLLRRPTERDLDRLLAWRNHPDVTRWLLHTTVDPEAYRERWRRDVLDPDDHGVVALVGDEVVATGSVDLRDGMGQPGGPLHHAEASIGYLLDPAWHGQGIATELLRALLDVAFDDLGVHRVTAGCFADNVGSWRVMEKAGMRREQHGVRDSWHAELGWLDGYTYGLLADERP